MMKAKLVLLVLATLGLSSLATAQPNLLSCRLSWGGVEARHVCYVERELFSVPPFLLSLGLEGVYTGQSVTLSPYLSLFLNLRELWLLFETGLSYRYPDNLYGLRHSVSFGMKW